MSTPKKHAKLIKAWADGARIEWKNNLGEWTPVNDPSWSDRSEYRIEVPAWQEKFRQAVRRS